MATKDIVSYVTAANKGKGKFKDKALLKGKTFGINDTGSHYNTYTTDVEITLDYESETFILTVMNQTLIVFLHKSIFWDSEYKFKFKTDKLTFTHEGKKMYLSI